MGFQKTGLFGHLSLGNYCVGVLGRLGFVRGSLRLGSSVLEGIFIGLEV